jgi:sugar/nucleoside kinase (ribokinase family)
MCSRLGGRSIILGNVGNDDNGKAYIENFKVKKQLKAATEKISSLEL